MDKNKQKKFEYEVVKSCSGNWKCCQYSAVTSEPYIYCKYEGYCIYQLPNDGSLVDKTIDIINRDREYDK